MLRHAKLGLFWGACVSARVLKNLFNQISAEFDK